MDHIQKTDSKKGRWFILRNGIIEHADYLKLTLVELRLVHALLRFANSDGECYPSLRTLARFCIPNFDGETIPSRVLRALKAIESMGFVSVKRSRGGHGRPHAYRVQVPGETTGNSIVVSERRRIRITNDGQIERTTTGKLNVNDGQIDRRNSFRTQGKTHSRTQRSGSPPSARVRRGRREEKIIEAFTSLGIQTTSLVKRSLHDQGSHWMRKVLAESRGKMNPVAFAAWALKHPAEVRLNGEGQEDHDYEDDHTVGVAVEEANPNRARLIEADDYEDNYVERCEGVSCWARVTNGKCSRGHVQAN